MSIPQPRPLPAFEPPYVMTVFTSVRTRGGEEYDATSERMTELVKEIPGYLGHENAHTPGGLSITVGYFRDEAALIAWRTDEEHRAAQKQGRADWYDSYTLHVATVERSHGFVR
ncbi:antibiotic biosynthesis monooxygenase [Streptomyces bambusae]|uniref:antibiotic biosynthesis monooxygenase family protein n=1 Tax=Streptomyces bambusae TaxID=1550616 RepID=UPI001CFCB84A|nr:antibiotic biosynthesis monooxygenase [Streptomyces bambusae]MCB5168909.1 antibiotic biosynthesis monooxygenase [Streptomyces bambusae]